MNSSNEHAAPKLTSDYEELPDPYSVPLDSLDVSDPRLNELDQHTMYFKRLRDEDPLHYHKDSKFGPFWSVTRFEDVMKVDADYSTYCSKAGIFIADEPPEMKLETFLHLPPPEHDRQRMAVQPVVAPKNLVELEPIIRSRAGALLDAIPVGETFNWVDHVSVELTLQMLATLFDFPMADRHRLAYWSELGAAGEELSGDTGMTMEERAAGLQECAGVFAEMWQEREAAIKAGTRSADSIDLLTKLITNDSTKDIINRPMEFIGNIMLLVIGGNDTTRNTISGSVLALNEFPDQYSKLSSNPDLIASMVPEAIRWQTPLGYMRRTATTKTELGGKQIKKGDKVVMWYISANRDESAIDKPFDFIIDRENPRHHAAFGFGVHRCMGNRLAEMQLRIVWEEILRRFSKVEVVGEPVRARNNLVRGIKDLPVKVHLH